MDEFNPNEEPTVSNDRVVPQNNSRPAYTAPTWVNNPPVNGTNQRTPTMTVGSYYKDSVIPPPPPIAQESAARARMRRRRVRGRHSGGEWAWVIIAGAMLAVGIVVSMAIFLLLRVSQDKPEVIPTVVAQLPTPVDARSNLSGELFDGQTITLDDGRSIVLEKWDGESRFTVLMVGLDRRPGETGLAYRTDTMMLVSLDPATQTLGILSIPRDLFVDIPGYSEPQRVNSAMVYGEIRQPGYGPTLAMQTVQWNLGIRVNEYIAVDFNAFISVVDAIGGIDIEVPYNIADPQYPDMYYGYDPFYISQGLQHLDGKMALKYARTRHGDSDFERAKRQQQVLYAIRDRVLSFNMLPQMIIQAPSLYGSLKDNVYTGLTVDQMIPLALYLKDIPAENIRTGVIDSQYTIGWRQPSTGAQVEIPDRARIGQLMVNVFGPNYSE